MPDYLLILIKFLIPFLLGGLFFFAILVAPNVFKTLDEKNSRLFLRGIFPTLYFYSRQYLMIRINKASDQKNQKEFKKLHRFSVLIFIIQILLMILIFLVL